MNFQVKVDGKINTIEASKVLFNRSSMHNSNNDLLKKVILTARDNADRKNNTEAGNILHKMAQKFSHNLPDEYISIHISKEEAIALKKYLIAEIFSCQKRKLAEHLLKEADFALEKK